MDNTGMIPKTDHAAILEKLDQLDNKVTMLLRVAQTYIELNPEIKQVFNGMRTDKGCGGDCPECECK